MNRLFPTINYYIVLKGSLQNWAISIVPSPARLAAIQTLSMPRKPLEA